MWPISHLHPAFIYHPPPTQVRISYSGHVMNPSSDSHIRDSCCKLKTTVALWSREDDRNLRPENYFFRAPVGSSQLFIATFSPGGLRLNFHASIRHPVDSTEIVRGVVKSNFVQF